MRFRGAMAGVALAIAFIAPAVAAAPAHAAAYRYWSYWVGADGGWSFANVGPAFRVPDDGAVEGWRFSVSGVAGNDQPGFAPDFEAVCADTPAEDGRKRVAVVVDPGAPQDAPEGEAPPGAWALCVVAEPRATGYDVLRAAAGVRVQDGLICAINDYPAAECAVVVGDPTPTPKPTKTQQPAPKPSKTATPTTAPATPTSASASAQPVSPEPTSAQPTASADSSTAVASSPASATPDATASPTPDSPSPTAPPSPSPSPSLSMLAEPLPPSDGGGSGSALGVGAAVVGICALGGAAVVMMRRRPS